MIIKIIFLVTGSEAIQIKLSEMGAVLKASLSCKLCKHLWKWQSLGEQPQDVKMVNAQFTGAILYTGCRPTQLLG